jgi:hypothetical protein
MPRAEAQTLIRQNLLDVYQGVEHYVPPKARLGVVLSFDDWDYPLYGPTLQRRLVPVPQVDTLRFAERHHIHWVLLDRDALRPPPRATWNTVYFQNSRWTMYLRPEELG